MRNYFFWRSVLCLTFSVEAVIYSSIFHKIPDPTKAVFTIITSVKASDISECSIKCVNEQLACFLYNGNLKRCDLGYCKAISLASGTGVTLGANEDMYLTCDKKAGFELFTSGSVTTCASGYSSPITYTAARDACRAKGAFLYAVKNVDKLKIIQKYFTATYDFWNGPNYWDQDGNYWWEDDNSTLDESLRLQVFFTGEPDKKGGVELCIIYHFNGLLYDVPCAQNMAYICEQPFVNFPFL